jgi:dihydroorotate dehydrogenase (NAD+) catalytic subunit
MLNSIGLQGPGIEVFLENDVPWLVEQNVKTIVSIAGETVDEYGVLSRRLRSVAGISAVEVNISCPNVENRGQVFSCHPDTAVAVIESVRRNIGGELPIVAKLSPDVTDIVEIASAVIKAGVDGLALINTLLGMVIDTNTMKPKLAGKTGGLSGPAIRPIAVRAIYQVHQAFPQIPIVGMGGVSTGRDAFELILAGASAVSIGTANFGNPTAAVSVKHELSDLLTQHGFKDFRDAVGYAHRSS